MVIAFTKCIENSKDPVSEGLHVYVISNLRDKNTRSNKEIAGALRTYANLMPCSYKMALSSRIPTTKILNSHSSDIKGANVVALPLSSPKLQIVQ